MLDAVSSCWMCLVANASRWVAWMSTRKGCKLWSRCRELEIRNSKRSSLRPWRPSDSQMLEAAFIVAYSGICWHCGGPLVAPIHPYPSKVWLHQWPGWISSSEGVSTYRALRDSPLRLPHGQSGKWPGRDQWQPVTASGNEQPGLCFKLLSSGNWT